MARRGLRQGKFLGKEQVKTVLVQFSQSKRQQAVVRTAKHGKWQGGARRGSRHGKVPGTEQGKGVLV